MRHFQHDKCLPDGITWLSMWNVWCTLLSALAFCVCRQSRMRLFHHLRGQSETTAHIEAPMSRNNHIYNTIQCMFCHSFVKWLAELTCKSVFPILDFSYGQFIPFGFRGPRRVPYADRKGITLPAHIISPSFLELGSCFFVDSCFVHGLRVLRLWYRFFSFFYMDMLWSVRFIRCFSWYIPYLGDITQSKHIAHALLWRSLELWRIAHPCILCASRSETHRIANWIFFSQYIKFSWPLSQHCLTRLINHGICYMRHDS